MSRQLKDCGHRRPVRLPSKAWNTHFVGARCFLGIHRGFAG